jgi:hypothetical protein
MRAFGAPVILGQHCIYKTMHAGAARAGRVGFGQYVLGDCCDEIALFARESTRTPSAVCPWGVAAGEESSDGWRREDSAKQQNGAPQRFTTIDVVDGVRHDYWQAAVSSCIVSSE